MDYSKLEASGSPWIQAIKGIADFCLALKLELGPCAVEDMIADCMELLLPLVSPRIVLEPGGYSFAIAGGH